MPINVTCPNCHSRFQVSEKFAGQTGPCPKCKERIKVPEQEEEVVIHAPEEFGPKTTTGESVLKPIEREETSIGLPAILGVIGFCLGILVVAFVLRQSYQDSEDGVPMLWLGIGAVLLGPPVAYGCYSFLRNDELEPYRGSALIIRSSICGLVYAALWGVYSLLVQYLFNGQVEVFQLIYLAPPLIAAGAVASLASLDLDFTNGAIHFASYVAVTVALLFLMGTPPI